MIRDRFFFLLQGLFRSFLSRGKVKNLRKSKKCCKVSRIILKCCKVLKCQKNVARSRPCIGILLQGLHSSSSGQAPENDAAKDTVVADDDASSAVPQRAAQDLLSAWTASDLDALDAASDHLQVRLQKTMPPKTRSLRTTMHPAPFRSAPPKICYRRGRPPIWTHSTPHPTPATTRPPPRTLRTTDRRRVPKMPSRHPAIADIPPSQASRHRRQEQIRAMKPWQVAAHCKREAEYHRWIGFHSALCASRTDDHRLRREAGLQIGRLTTAYEEDDDAKKVRREDRAHQGGCRPSPSKNWAKKMKWTKMRRRRTYPTPTATMRGNSWPR